MTCFGERPDYVVTSESFSECPPVSILHSQSKMLFWQTFKKIVNRIKNDYIKTIKIVAAKGKKQAGLHFISNVINHEKVNELNSFNKSMSEFVGIILPNYNKIITDEWINKICN